MKDGDIPEGVTIGLSDGEADLEGVLRLQRENLEVTVGADEAASQGYVTVVHTREALAAMHAIAPSVVARGPSGEVVAYALVMPVECRPFVPILEPMFAKLAGLDLGGARVYIMGQVCVAKAWRGRGLFDALHDYLVSLRAGCGSHGRPARGLRPRGLVRRSFGYASAAAPGALARRLGPASPRSALQPTK
ncbi:MAG: hypothetical protein IT385_11680 [Deltaproteobacteria bacterium]|nr:hypothetical protein [Deltaproteobacteria bacterium]